MTFYLLVPLLVNTIKSLKDAINFTALSLLLSIALKLILINTVLISSERLWNEYLFLYFPNQLPVFGFGIMLYFIVINKDFRLSSINYILILFTLIIMVFYKEFVSSNIHFALIFFILFFILTKKNLKPLVNKMTVFIGNVSYSAYLVHFALLHWMSHYKLLNIIN